MSPFSFQHLACWKPTCWQHGSNVVTLLIFLLKPNTGVLAFLCHLGPCSLAQNLVKQEEDRESPILVFLLLTLRHEDVHHTSGTLPWGHEDGGVCGCRCASHHPRGESFSQHEPSWASVVGAVLGAGRWGKTWLGKRAISGHHCPRHEPDGPGVEM